MFGYNEYRVNPEPDPYYEGMRFVYVFPNGFGACVIKHEEEPLWGGSNNLQ